ncbi:MAG: DUF72 domain-containing protein [Chloroflexi bacterium]|nr:DUF72 domain-containing protein [Chloroflexota bacterium]
MSGRIYVGTSTWADQALVQGGNFYPPEAKDTPSRLAHFARHFELAEVDNTYYSLPSRRLLEQWAAAVPGGFRFNVKVFALLSQHPTRIGSISAKFREELPPEAQKKGRVYYKDVPEPIRDEMWRIFRENLQPLREAGKLGAVLIDFPPWFVPSDANRDFIAHARQRVPDDPVLVQFRNPLWAADEETAASTFALLRELRCGFVCVDEPPGLKSSFPPVVAATAPAAAVRFRGRNAERWEDRAARAEERLNWHYSDEELAEWVPRIRQLAEEAEEVYLGFNTKAEDQGVANALRLKELLASAGVGKGS